ncbi:hypothetical protein EMIT048CA2_250027 [Pseudomonas chlororaphis]
MHALEALQRIFQVIAPVAPAFGEHPRGCSLSALGKRERLEPGVAEGDRRLTAFLIATGSRFHD